MRIAFIGSKGIPASYGGFERFVDEVSVGLTKLGYNIYVVGDAEQYEQMKGQEKYKGVNLLYSKYTKSKNPIKFYFESMMLVLRKAEIIYSCGSGAGFISFLPKIFGKILVTNTDGLGWKRDKYSPIKQFALKSLIYFATKWSQYLVFDAKGLEGIFNDVFSLTNKGIVIEYGAYENTFVGVKSKTVSDILEKYGLVKGSYHLLVCRLEPENNVLTIIKGYNMSVKKYPLIIIGSLTGNDYVTNLHSYANDNIRFVGGIYDKGELEIVRANAKTYLHGHSVGGTNPSLLEAMASKNYCICHDNIFTREVLQENGVFFKNEYDVNKQIGYVEHDILNEVYEKTKAGAFNRIVSYYNWDRIIKKYDDFLKSIKS